MGFINTQSALIYDSDNSIHHFHLEENQLVYVKADALTKKVESNVLEKNVSEFDAVIDENDVILIICKTHDQVLLLFEVFEGQSISHIIAKQLKPGLSNIHIFGNKDRVNVIYTMPDDEAEERHLIMHSCYSGGEWENKEIGNFLSPVGLLENEISVMIEKDDGYIGFVEYLNNKGCLHLKKYDGVSWSEDILTIEKQEEVYWYDLQKRDDILEFVYAFKDQGQFAICYESFNIKERKSIEQKIISNVSNNMHPIFVTYKNEQWIIWTEMDSVVSCRISNQGKYVDGPYKWKESKKTDFIKCKFSYNNETIKNQLGMQCAYVYSTFPEYSLLGFGHIKGQAESVAAYKKKDSQEEDEMGTIDHKRVPNKEEEQKEVKKKEVTQLDRIAILEQRVENIENYLKRRSRMFGPKR